MCTKTNKYPDSCYSEISTKHHVFVDADDSHGSMLTLQWTVDAVCDVSRPCDVMIRFALQPHNQHK